MSGLLELGPMTADIVVMGKTLTLHPISTGEVINLFARFPVLVTMLDGNASREDMVASVGLTALAHVITCSTGESNNPEALTVANRLGIGKTIEIVEKIIEITFEDGVDPFMVRIRKMTGVVTALKEDLVPESSAPWSASLVGDEPKNPHSGRPRDN